MKLSKKDFKLFNKEEQELLSMVATMSTGDSIEPKNLHLMSKQGMKETLTMMKKEQKTMSTQGKKMVQSILNKAKSLTEQYRMPQEDEEDEATKLAKRTLQSFRDAMDKTSPGMGSMMKPGAVRPLETGQPGALSADLGFSDLEGMVRKPSLPPPPSTGQAPSPSMDMGQMPPMGGQMPPMDREDMPPPGEVGKLPDNAEDLGKLIDYMRDTGQDVEYEAEMSASGYMPSMGGQMPKMPPMGRQMPKMPPMGGQMPPMPPMGGQMPPMPSIDDQPGLPPQPRQAASATPMGGMGMPGGGPPSETEGPRAMEPADGFGKRMGIKDIERHRLRPEEDNMYMDMAPETPEEPKSGMPNPGMMPPQEGPQQGQPVPSKLLQDPAAPKEMPRQQPPGTTEASQEFVDKYAQQIKSFLNKILRDEEEKFATGRDLTAMPKNFKEQVANAVGSGMSPVMGNEGGIKGRDKMLGGSGGMRRRMIRRRM